jgi:hypothetical protein
MGIATLIGGIVSLVVGIILAISCASAWYVVVSYDDTTKCTSTYAFFTNQLSVSCTPECDDIPNNGCKNNYEYSDENCPLGRLFSFYAANGKLCQTAHRGTTIKASVAMSAIGAILALVNGIILILLFFVGALGSLAGPLSKLRALRIPMILAIVVLIVILLALIILGGGWVNASKADEDCGGVAEPICFDLIDKENWPAPNQDSYWQVGPGFAYWFAMIAGFVNIAVIIIAVIVGTGGGESK